MLSSSPLLTNGNEKYPVRTVAFLVLLFLLNLALGIVIPILSQSNSLYSVELLYDYQPGQLANEDVIAPYDFSFVDESATEEAREANARAVLPCFRFSLAETLASEARLDAVLAVMNGDADLDSLALEEGSEEVSSMVVRWQLLDSSDQNAVKLLLEDAVDHLLENGVFNQDDLDLVGSEGYRTCYAQLPGGNGYELETGMSYLENLTSDEDLQNALIAFLQDYSISLTPAAFTLLDDLVQTIVSANVTYDAFETESLRSQARAATPDVTAEIHRGDYILRYDRIVTEKDLQTIRMINGITVDFSFPQLVGRLVFLAVLLYVSLSFIRSFIERKYRVLVHTVIFLITLALVLIMSYLATFFFQQLSSSGAQVLPYLFMPLLMTQLTAKKRIGFLSGTLYACFIIFFPDTDMMTFFYLLFAIEISLLFVRFSVTRLDMIYQGFYTALANIMITVLFHFIEDRPLIDLFQEVVAVALNVGVTCIVVSLLLPVLEHFLNIPTVFRLHELSSTDSPALVRLRSQAIGSYNHSMNVSDMAYNAAKEIGANAELAKVGGLYHDIGKAEHPEYFIENQGGGPNVHDEMKYTLSAAVIKSHVKQGVEKGREMGLPQEVLDIIDQHHGNDIISYFYNRAVEEAKASNSPIQVNEEDFRYNSDIPQTREAGIVMLADCFEAASRTLKKPTTLRYEKLFTSILVGKMNGNQLDDCMLSMAEIEKIKRVFVHQAFGRDHMRIQYTKDENDA